MPYHRLVIRVSKFVRPFAGALIAIIASGCTIALKQEAPQKPQFRATAFAIAPVGNVAPIHLDVTCVRACPQHYQLSSQDVVAITSDGKMTRKALELNEAVAAAGGSPVLARAVSNASDLQTAAGVTVVGGAVGAALGSGGPGVFLTVPLGVVAGAFYSGYMAALDPEELQRVKIIFETFGRTDTGASGWIFFPKDKYSGIKIVVMPAPATKSEGEAAPLAVITLPWKEGSSAMAAEFIPREQDVSPYQSVNLPPVAPAPPGRSGTAIGLMKAVDARPDPRITELWAAGPEIASQSEALMANELARRGYAVERIPPAPGSPAPRRAVKMAVLAMVGPLPMMTGEIVLRATVEVTVVDAQGRRIFSAIYTGEERYPQSQQAYSLITYSREGANVVGQTVSDAIGLAIAKACSDPGFVAAIRGESSAERSASSAQSPEE